MQNSLGNGSSSLFGQELLLPLDLLVPLVAIMTRIGGIFLFLRLPGFVSVAPQVRTFLVLLLSVALLPAVQVSLPPVNSAELGLRWLGAEMLFGALLGLVVQLAQEALQFAAQLLGYQIGLSYASVVDPASEADTTSLQTLFSLLGGFLFFSAGADRWLLGELIRSFATVPLGSFLPQEAQWQLLAALMAQVFSVGLRFALPMIALFLLLDLAFALLARLQAQLQVSTFMQPAKLLAAFAALAILVRFIPSTFASQWQRVQQAAHSLMGGA